MCRRWPAGRARPCASTASPRCPTVVAWWRSASGRRPTTPPIRPAWSSTDGEHWQRDDVADLVPDDSEHRPSLSAVVATPSGPVAVGIDDEGPVQHYRTAVRDATGRWRLGGTFGPTTNDELPRVGALGSVGGRSVALVRVAGEYLLFWADGGTEHWHPGPTPEAVPAGNDTSVVLAGSSDELRLVVNRPGGAGWWATAGGLSRAECRRSRITGRAE